MKNFAMLGGWHVHAAGYAKELNSLPGCRVAKVWDKDASLAEKWAKELGAESASLEDILADEGICGVAVTTATNEHPDILIRAIEAGKAVFTEKVLTLTNENAARVREAVIKYNTRFVISFPHLSNGAVRFALEAAKGGKLGELNYVRVRNVHDGAIADWLPPHFYDPIPTGGGAMMDLGAHPMYLIGEFLGTPVRVTSAFTKVTGHAVEDNAVSLLEYANGAIGVSETGFVSRFCPFTLEVGGSLGYLSVHGHDLTWCCPETDNKPAAPAIPADRVSPLEIWAGESEIPAELGIDAAVRLTALMVAAYKGTGK